MKKLFLLMLTAIIACSIVACTGGKKDQNETENKEVTENSETEDKEEKLDEEITPQDVEEKKVKTVKVPGREIYVDYDMTMRKKDEPYTILMYKNNDSLVGLAFKKDVSYTGNVDEVINLFKTDFINDVSTSSSGNLYGSEIVVKNTEKVTVAGYESIKFTGTVLNKSTWECHVYGYTFVIDGVPCAVIGLVSAQAQDANMIAEIDKQVDEIASTIRNTK